VPAEKLVMDCSIDGESMTITMNTVVECVGAVCDASQYAEHVANLNQNPEVQEILTSMGADCTFSTDAASEDDTDDPRSTDAASEDDTSSSDVLSVSRFASLVSFALLLNAL
jgi:hypothetical protein